MLMLKHAKAKASQEASKANRQSQKGSVLILMLCATCEFSGRRRRKTGAATLDAASLALTGAVTVATGIQSTAIARTGTDDGTSAGTIAAGTSMVLVDADSDANHIIILPAPVVGNIIHFIKRRCILCNLCLLGGSLASRLLPLRSLVCFFSLPPHCRDSFPRSFPCWNPLV